MDTSGHETFETAAEHASTRVPVVSPESSAGQIRAGLVGREFENASHIAVCEAGGFLGVLRIEALLAAPEAATARELMDSTAPVVAPGVDQEVVARTAVRHQEAALAVVDAQGAFVGMIPPDRLLAVLLTEHDEDLARMGGFLAHSKSARDASQEPVPLRFWHRLPWLLVGLAGAVFAADMVGWFETRLREKVILAFFVPSIVYLADAVGTQTETIVVRGLSVGVTMRRMLAREILAGLVIGFVLAAIAFPILWWRWGERDVAVGVALSVLATCSTATAAALSLPWLFDRAGVDPAFGSGPLATVIQDLLSILIYFAIMTTLVP